MKEELRQSLRSIVNSHAHGWCPVADIEKMFEDHGYSIDVLERNNRTDGEYHKRFSSSGNSIEVHANVWSAASFIKALKLDANKD